MTDPAPILTFAPLANRHGQLDALVLSLGCPQAPGWIPLDPQLTDLAHAMVCRYHAPQGLPEALCQTLIEAGVLPLSVEDVHSDPSVAPDANGRHRWYASHWYLSPPAKPSASQVASRALALKLVQLVADDADTFEIESVFRQEPTLAYHLLRLVNSPGLGVGREITNFSQAILILGRQRLRRWLNLLLFAASRDDPRAPMLLTVAAVRARLMELIFQHLGHDRRAQDRAFMTGLFSLIGVLFGQPLADLLRPLQISDDVVMALLHHQGGLGAALRIAEAADAPDPDELGRQLAAQQIAAADYNHLLITTQLWMLDVVRSTRRSDA